MNKTMGWFSTNVWIRSWVSSGDSDKKSSSDMRRTGVTDVDRDEMAPNAAVGDNNGEKAAAVLSATSAAKRARDVPNIMAAGTRKGFENIAISVKISSNRSRLTI